MDAATSQVPEVVEEPLGQGDVAWRHYSSGAVDGRRAAMKSEEELREAFESVDSDESGVIDGDEVRADPG